jgi:hypothetical protein
MDDIPCSLGRIFHGVGCTVCVCVCYCSVFTMDGLRIGQVGGWRGMSLGVDCPAHGSVRRSITVIDEIDSI